MQKIIIFDNKYNALRDDALRRIEADDDKPNNAELNFLGLTTYLLNDDLNSNIFDKIINIQNAKRKIQHIQDKDLYFMPLQVEALNYLFNHKRATILAPTSFGKTLIMKEYIFVKKPRSVVYIVPTNSLSYELENDFKKNESFQGYDIFNKSIKSKDITNKKLPFFIGTQEKFGEIESLFPEVDLFIIDEAYKLSDSIDEQRGYILSKTFLDSVKLRANQLVLLCPNAKLFGFKEYGFVETFETTFNAVSKSFIKCENKDDLFCKLNEKSTNSKTILFCEKPADITDAFKSINLELSCYSNSQFLNDLISDFHEEWSVVKYLKKGILVHHGQMPKYIQNKMINIFNNDIRANLLIGTNSISEGINTPTKHLFIDPSVEASQKLMLIKNTIGRAGRLGKMPVGYIYSIEDIESIYKNDPYVVLSVSDQGKLNTIEDSENEEKIAAVAEQFSLDRLLIKRLLNNNQISLFRLIKILSSLKEDQKYPYYSTIVFMSKKCMDTSFNPLEEKTFLTGLFQNQFKKNDGETGYINNYRDRIAYYKYKMNTSKKSDSEIIDGYMRFMYSTLDYKILPIAIIAKSIHDEKPDWVFGNNTYEIVSVFLKRYYKSIYGIDNFDSLDDDVKSIVLSLREYGINFNDPIISINLFNEVKTRLSSRYSMYDVIKALKEISEDRENKFCNVCTYLLRKYIY